MAVFIFVPFECWKCTDHILRKQLFLNNHNPLIFAAFIYVSIITIILPFFTFFLGFLKVFKYNSSKKRNILRMYESGDYEGVIELALFSRFKLKEITELTKLKNTSLLRIACQYLNIHAVRCLLHYGFAINESLLTSIFEGGCTDYNVILFLLQKKAKIDVNAKNYDGDNILIYICRLSAQYNIETNQIINLLQYLIEECKCNINETNDKNETGLMYAAKSGNNRVFQWMLKQKNIHIHCVDSNGKSVKDWILQTDSPSHKIYYCGYTMDDERRPGNNFNYPPHQKRNIRQLGGSRLKLSLERHSNTPRKNKDQVFRFDENQLHVMNMSPTSSVNTPRNNTTSKNNNSNHKKRKKSRRNKSKNWTKDKSKNNRKKHKSKKTKKIHDRTLTDIDGMKNAFNFKRSNIILPKLELKRETNSNRIKKYNKRESFHRRKSRTVDFDMNTHTQRELRELKDIMEQNKSQFDDSSCDD
eukprot:213960_1